MNRRMGAGATALLLGMAMLAVPTAGTGQPKDGKKDFGGPFGKGFGGPFGQTRKILKEYDKDGDGILNNAERKVAREALKDQGGFGGFGPKGGFGKGGFGPKLEPAKPGPHVAPADVTSYPNAGLYDGTVLRTLFLDFENKDWEAELQDFHNSDVEVPCTLTVDGKKYPNVGVHFRGMSSYFTIPAGHKRSLNLSMDLVDKKQRLYGAKTLNLLNSHEDSSFLGTVIYSHIARQYIPAPRANLVKVVINGESWGIYVNAEQFNKEFVTANFKTPKSARWKVRGNPGAAGGLEYIGDNIADYKRRFEIKSDDNEKDWKALINLCKVLNETPPDKLEEALRPILDLDGVLWFLALDIALINNDGYWTRSSDFSIARDEKGVFHIIPHDMNEAFRPAIFFGFGGPGRGPGGGGPGGPPKGGFGPPGGGPGGPPGGFPGGPPGGLPGGGPAGGPPVGFPGGPPGGGFGPPGGGPGGFVFQAPRPGEVIPEFMQGMLQLTDAQKAKLAEIQKEVDAKIEKLLTPDQRSQMRRMREGGIGFAMGGPMAGPQSGGVTLDPLTGLADTRKPLRMKLLAVPSLRKKYLENVRTIADKSLEWKALSPVVAQYRKLIQKEVEADTKKLESYEAFLWSTADSGETKGQPLTRGEMPIRAFADQRRKFLLEYKEPKKSGS